jgi:predicted amidophosphoribosyltransferase
MLKPFIAAALDLLFRPLCHVCRKFIPVAGELQICSGCREQIPLIMTPLCPVCGIPFAGAGNDHVCGACSTSPPSFDAARAALAYEGAGRDLIHSFKYRIKTHL